jgi:hypothetical protein
MNPSRNEFSQLECPALRVASPPVCHGSTAAGALPRQRKSGLAFWYDGGSVP